jgi:uncharacterized protein YceK
MNDKRQLFIFGLLALIVWASCLNVIPEAGKNQAQAIIYTLLVMVDPRPQQRLTPEIGGIILKSFLIVLVLSSVLLSLAGCGAMNEYTGAALNYTEQGYAGAKQNVKNAEAAKTQMWADAAGLLTVEGLSQAQPNVIEAALKVHPLPGVAIIHSSDGSIVISSGTANHSVVIPPAFTGGK